MARAWERRATGPRLVDELPVAVVDGRDGAGAHDLLELVAGEARHLGDGVLERDLDLGQRRDRHPDRQVVVEDVVLAHVAVGEHVVAERLGVAQPGAVADHQPDVGAQHGDMVGDGLGVRRADADVDHRDAGVARADEVEGRHLRRAPDRCAGAPVPGDDGVAGLDEGGVAGGGVGDGLERELDELVHVELVVGEQHVVLEVRGARRGVVGEPQQRIVDALGGERARADGRRRGGRCR